MINRLFVIATSAIVMLAGCTKSESSFVSMKVDGKTYTSTVMTDENHSVFASSQLFELSEDGFSFFYRNAMSSSGAPEITLMLRISDSTPTPSGMKFEFPSGPSSLDGYDTASISMTIEGRPMHYYAIEGWLEIDNVDNLNDDICAVNGSFAFSAKEEFSGKVIEITDGRLHNAFMARKRQSLIINAK